MTTKATKRNATQWAKETREGKEQTYIGTHGLTRDTQSSSHNINNLRYIEEEMTQPLVYQRGLDYVKRRMSGGEYYTRGIGCCQNRSKEREEEQMGVRNMK